MKTIKTLSVILLLSVSLSNAQQDTIIYNESTGNYTVQYVDQNGELISQTYIPWNKINPSINCKVDFLIDGREYVYNWRLLSSGIVFIPQKT